jgi:flagellar biosynthesis protein FliQ
MGFVDGFIGPKFWADIMTPGNVMEIGRQAIEATLLLSAPGLLAALIIGLVVSIFQAATQINEQTLSFIPKIVGVFLVLLLAGPWMLSYVTEYFQRLFNSIPGMIG